MCCSKYYRQRMERNSTQWEIEFLRYVMTNEVGGRIWKMSRQSKRRIGLANYYHHFIWEFPKVTRTLFNLLKKWLSQEWIEPCHQAFGELKNKFSSQDVVKFPGFQKPFEVHMEADDFTIGRCWSKMDDHWI